MVNIAGKKLKLAIWDTGTVAQPITTPLSFFGYPAEQWRPQTAVS
jgi:hypothetical protein